MNSTNDSGLPIQPPLPDANRQHLGTTIEERHSFVYAFSIESTIPNSKSLSESDKASAECNAVDVIYESFVVTGDQDYLTARMLACNGLPRGFYWAASQTIEKYLKAFLLLHGVSVKDNRFRSHTVQELFSRACSIDQSLRGIELRPHDEVALPDGANSLLKHLVVEDFLSSIERHGMPDNRYNAFGVDFDTTHLFALDHFAYVLRGKLSVPDIWHSLSRVNEDFAAILMRGNPWFAQSSGAPTSVTIGGPIAFTISSAATKLDFLLKNSDRLAYRLALDWLNQMMLLPKSVVETLKSKPSRFSG